MQSAPSRTRAVLRPSSDHRNDYRPKRPCMRGGTPSQHSRSRFPRRHQQHGPFKACGEVRASHLPEPAPQISSLLRQQPPRLLMPSRSRSSVGLPQHHDCARLPGLGSVVGAAVGIFHGVGKSGLDHKRIDFQYFSQQRTRRCPKAVNGLDRRTVAQGRQRARRGLSLIGRWWLRSPGDTITPWPVTGCR